MARLFTKIETLVVSECGSLEEIFPVEGQEKDIREVANFNSANLELLPINNDQIKSDQHSLDFYFQNLRELKIKGCDSLKCLLSFSIAASLRNLNSLSIMECKMMEEIFNPHEINTDQAKVANSNSGNLELLPINNHQIRNDLPSPNFYFQNLIKLNVKGCDGLKYLLSFFIAASLRNLNILSIIECKTMEGIFNPQEINTDQAKLSIFPKLEEIQLIGMERLTTIWHSHVDPNSYIMLDSVVIEECPKLVTIFPNYMVGRISFLVRLKVVNCQLVEEIFDINDTAQMNLDETETCLRSVHLEALPNLKHIWNRDSKGILSFKYLKKVWVSKCSKLKNIVPVSVASGLEYGESLTIKDCNDIRAIVC